jgi:hypothetical protein
MTAAAVVEAKEEVLLASESVHNTCPPTTAR